MKEPNGVVTFLFTDIEASTKLAQDFPDSLPAALEKHHSIMHKAIESNNGFVFEIVGDAFCCAFDKASDAVKAAVDAQINLTNEKWDDVKIKIRIGIHTGNAEWNGKRYMGYITLAQTARVMSAAYGEQILISNDAYDSLKSVTNQEIRNEGVASSSKSPDWERKQGDITIQEIRNEGVASRSKSPDWERKQGDISFRDLGERKLKDLKQPMRLYQVITSGLVSNFPPLKTLDARPNNLPVQLTSFIGREAEMKHVKGLLKQTHLLTLTGSGGAGKTRFALQVGADVIDDFANGVWFVELAALFEPALLPQAIMKVFGVKEEPKRSLEETLCDYLRDKEILIILDNCEHLIEACAKLTEKLLSSSPKLKIIATSRESLRCEGEQIHIMLFLDSPNPNEEISLEKLSQYEAVQLFVERALAVDKNFRVDKENAQSLVKICYQLDGIPLALELAAARTKILSVKKIYERLNDRFNLLTGGKRTALPRQQTLKALIDWSHDLLSEKEKILWRRLSVFADGWIFEASEVVCTDEKIEKEEVLELLNQLAEKSIIIYVNNLERYRILETLKQYGGKKLKEANEVEDISSKHLNYYMEFSEKAESRLNGNEAWIWLEKLESEHDNLQSAIGWSISEADREKGARLAGALGNFWNIRGHYSIGRGWLEKILDNKYGVSKSALRKVLNCNGILARNQGQYEQAQRSHEESLTLANEVGDKLDIANSLAGIGKIALEKGNYEEAQKSYEKCLKLYREIGDKRGIAQSYNNLGLIADYVGNYVKAQKIYEKCLSLYREIEDKRGIAQSHHNLGLIAYYRGNYEHAQNIYEESLSLYLELGDKRGIAQSHHNLGFIAYFRGNYERAQKIYEECLALYLELGDKRGIAQSHYNLGLIAYFRGNYEQAQKIYKENITLFRELGDKLGIANSLTNLGLVASSLGNYEQAKKFYEESLSLSLEIGNKHCIAESLIGFARILSSGKHPSRAVILLGVIETNVKSMSDTPGTDKQSLQEQIINKLHELFSEEEYSKYYEEGKKLTLEQAAELALSNVQ